MREHSELLKHSGFVPIIEPVKESLNGLTRALEAVGTAEGRVIVVANPACGDYADDHEALSKYLVSLEDAPHIVNGVLLTDALTANRALELCDHLSYRSLAVIHCGFTERREFETLAGNRLRDCTHVFFEEHCGKLYRRRFRSDKRVLVRDGFKRRLNRDYPPLEFFSDLHVTFAEEGVDGFGDFLIVGDDYSEMGGPAYAVAIHLTFIDPDNDGQMYIHHFVSDRSTTPTDPAGKFAEALSKLVTEVERADTKVERTDAVAEFLDLHHRRHFPGLGYVKKLSMKHHIQTLSNYLSAA